MTDTFNAGSEPTPVSAQADTYKCTRVKTWTDARKRARQTTKDFSGTLKPKESYAELMKRVDAEADAWLADKEAGT